MSKKHETVVSMPSDRELEVTRFFDAPREMVWKAWTDPKQVAQWWGPRGFSTTIEKMDVRTGGVWKHVMHGPDGTDYPNKSRFVEVVKHKRIVYKHGGGKKGGPSAQFECSWTFEDEKGGTRLTLRQVYKSKGARDLIIKTYGALEGAKQTFARLGEYLEAMAKA